MCSRPVAAWRAVRWGTLRLMEAPPHDVDSEEERIDWFAVDVEAMRVGIPWRPPFGLVLAIVALPAISFLVAGFLADRLALEAPDQLALVDVWRAVSGATLALGIVLAAAVPIAARAARGKPDVTLALLRNGFAVGVFGVAALVILHSTLACAIVLAGQRLLMGFATASLPAFILFAGLAAAVYLATSGAGPIRDVTAFDPAVPVDRSQARDLHAIVDRLSERVGVPAPQAIVLGASMEASTFRQALTPEGRTATGETLRLPLALLAVLPVALVEAIVAHELGHIRNGDTVHGARLAPTFARLAAAIEALRTETSPAGRIAVQPALMWLDYASDVAMGVIGEQRRAAESAADEVAVATVGPDAWATALVAVEMTGQFAADWEAIVEEAHRSPEVNAPATFAAFVRDAAPDVSLPDLVEASIFGTGPFHPALVTRLGAAGIKEPPLDVAGPSALEELVPDSRALVGRVLDAVRPAVLDAIVDVETSRLRNAPRLTPGTVAWLMVGAVFAAIFVAQGAFFHLSTGDTGLIIAIIAGLWLLYPLVYPWFQREVILERSGVRIRSWWSHFRDRDGRDRGWTRIAWTGSMSMTIGFDSIATLSNGTTKARWWAGIWPKRELRQLVDDLRARGAVVRFTSDLGEADHARHAVVWFAGGRFLLPEVRAADDGEMLEIRPAKVVGPGTIRLMSALVDRLHEPVKRRRNRDKPADSAYLASLVGLEVADFTERGRRLSVDGDRERWTITLAGEQGAWVLDARSDEMDLAEIMFGILGLDGDASSEGAVEAEPPNEP